MIKKHVGGVLNRECVLLSVWRIGFLMGQNSWYVGFIDERDFLWRRKFWRIFWRS
jgi:hypothetical protein